MRQRPIYLAATLIVMLLATLSCKDNPTGPLLPVSESDLLYDSIFQSIQMNGDPSGVSWDPGDKRNDLTLVDDFTWRITISLSESDLSDGKIVFKFSHDYSWSNQNIGHPSGGELGQAELGDSPGDIELPLTVDQGFYTFELNDETLQYTTNPEPSSGVLTGRVDFDGEAPEEGATVALWGLHETGSVELWEAEMDGDEFTFTGLADSIYTLRASATGYAPATSDTIRITDGSADFQEILLSQVFGSISGTVSFSDDPDPLPEAEVVAIETTTQIEAGRVMTDENGDYLIEALGAGIYELHFSAPGYRSAELTEIEIEGDEENSGNDVTLEVLAAISGTVSFSDDPDPLPEAIAVVLEAGTATEVGRDTTDATGFYRVLGIDIGIYDVHISAPGYQSADIEGIEITGSEESTGNDVTLEPTTAATPDLPWFTAVVDGSIDDGWDFLVDDPVGDSGWGSSNDFHAFHVAWDADNIYVAVSGGFDSGGNTVNIYVDKDFGAGTGVTDMSTIQGGSVGDHLRKNIDASGIAGFGADFASSVWALQYEAEVSDLSDPANVTALTDQLLVGTTSAVEFSVPWTSIYPDMGGGVPPYTELAFYCVIGGGGDEYLADDTLPAVSDATAPDAVIIVQVDTDGE